MSEKPWYEWRDFKTDPPTDFAAIIVCAESADPDKPLICQAWYDPKFGVSNMLANFIPSITHWMPRPPRPEKPA